MKKILKLFVASFVIGILFICSSNTSLAAPAREGDITWEVKKQTLYIKPVSGTKGKMKNYKLSSKKPWSNKSFNTIRIEKGVSQIGKYSFSNTKAKRIEIMEGTKIIEQGAFYGNKNLEYLRLPDKCTYIGHEAFKNSSNKNIDFILDYKSINMIQMGVDVFEGIPNSKSLTINIRRVAHMINFQYDSEHWKLYKAAQFNVVEKTPLKEVSGPSFTFEYYTGKPITFDLLLWDGLLQLSEGSDYTGTFSNNVNPGKATITYKGIGPYFTGTKTLTFDIRLPEVNNLKGSSLSSSSIQLKWSKNNVVDGYDIQRYDSRSKSYKTISTLKKSITSYTNKGLKPGTSYKYRIRTYKVINGKKVYSSFKNPVQVTTKKISNVSRFKVSSKTSSSIKLIWTKNSNASGYELERYNSGSKKYKKIATLKNTTTSYTNKALKSNSTYKYRIRSYKTVNGKKYYSSYSSVVSTKTLKK